MFPSVVRDAVECVSFRFSLCGGTMLEARLLLLIFAVAGEKLLCPLHVTENLNDGEKVGSAIVKDGIVFPRGTFFEYEGNLKGCVCNVTRCLRKCCPNGEAAVNNKCAPYEESFKIRTYVEDAFLDERPVDSFRLLHGNFCHVGKYKLNADFPSDRFYLQNNGIMYMPESDPTLLLPHEFCIEQFINTKTNKTDVTALVCFGDGNIIKKTRVYSLGKVSHHQIKSNFKSQRQTSTVSCSLTIVPT